MFIQVLVLYFNISFNIVNLISFLTSLLPAHLHHTYNYIIYTRPDKPQRLTELSKLALPSSSNVLMNIRDCIVMQYTASRVLPHHRVFMTLLHSQDQVTVMREFRDSDYIMSFHLLHNSIIIP